MSTHSKIEWTEITWNPITGCNKVSPGCQFCYAERMAYRLKAMQKPTYKNGFDFSIHREIFEKPLSIKKPSVIFVNSMSDIFHENLPDELILELFSIMNRAYWHTFQVLTKRDKRLNSMNNIIPWSENIWMGVSVENNDFSYRIDSLRNTDARIKFLSIEPLLGPIAKINLNNIDWVIVGGESGPNSREMKKEWVLEIKNECEKQKVPFFFKQWGGKNKKKNGRILEDKFWDEKP